MIASDPRRDPAPPREATLDVGEFDSHGTARSIFNGRSIEVEHAIPGERVEALVYGRRRRWARIVDIPSPAPDRVPAPCPHFHDGCGGCPWQMVDIQSQLSRKLENVKTQFTDAGVAVDIRGVQTETDPWRYRMTAGLSVGRQAGFRRRGTQSIVAVTDCLISHPLIGRMASVLNEAIESEGIPNYHGDVSLEVRVVDREEDAGLHTCIVPSPGSRHASIDAILPLARLIAGLETTVGVLYRHNQDLPQLLYGESVGNLSVSGHSFALSAATFFQTNLVLLPALLHNVVAAAEARPTDTVVDVYGGVGIFGLLLAPSVQRVVEIEIDPVGIECARRSAQDQGLTNVDFLSGTAESILSEVGNANIVVVDPPRAGLTPKVIQAIGVMRPERILYVSCLAKSLARDLVSFGEFGYTSSGIDLFDFYPQTPHVELFTLLRR